MCFAVDVIGFVFGVDNLLTLVKSVITGEHIAECDSEQEIGHSLKTEQLEADQQRGQRAVGDATGRSFRQPYTAWGRSP